MPEPTGNRMTLHPIPAFNDNYIWALADDLGRCVLVDPGQAAPALEFVQQQQLALAAILITHHHYDHIGGVAELLAQHPAPVYGHPWDTGPAVITPQEDQEFAIDNFALRFRLLAIPGHTDNHVAFYWPGDTQQAPILFSGDTLFAGGCGRLFGLPPELMFNSLAKLQQLPAATRVCCAHEYTLSNLAFARHWLPEDQALLARQQQVQALRDKGLPSVPSTLAEELATNPFLRTSDVALQQALCNATGQPLQTPLATFTLLRELKDSF